MRLVFGAEDGAARQGVQAHRFVAGFADGADHARVDLVDQHVLGDRDLADECLVREQPLGVEHRLGAGVVGAGGSGNDTIDAGIDDDLIGSVFEQLEVFFAAPLEAKLDAKVDANNRGYTPMNSETLAPPLQTIADTKEGYYIGREAVADKPSPETKPALQLEPHSPCSSRRSGKR